MFRHERESSSGGCLIAFGFTFALPGLGFVAAAFFEGEIIGAFFGGIFALVGLAVLAAGVHQMMGDSLFKDFHLETLERHTLLGQTIPFKICWTGKKNFRVDSVQASYFLEEKAVLQRGTNSTTFSKKLYQQEVNFDLGQDFRSGESRTLEGTFKAPEDGPSSFKGDHNSLIWKLEVTMDVPNWPDPNATWSITMKPFLAEELAEAVTEEEAEG
jgi:hypothetical protein